MIASVLHRTAPSPSSATPARLPAAPARHTRASASSEPTVSRYAASNAAAAPVRSPEDASTTPSVFSSTNRCHRGPSGSRPGLLAEQPVGRRPLLVARPRSASNARLAYRFAMYSGACRAASATVAVASCSASDEPARHHQQADPAVAQRHLLCRLGVDQRRLDVLPRLVPPVEQRAGCPRARRRPSPARGPSAMASASVSRSTACCRSPIRSTTCARFSRLCARSSGGAAASCGFQLVPRGGEVACRCEPHALVVQVGPDAHRAIRSVSVADGDRRGTARRR